MSAMELKDIVRQARRALKITQTELGHRVGTTPSAINKIESGVTQHLSGEMIVKLSAALSLPAEALLPSGKAEVRPASAPAPRQAAPAAPQAPASRWSDVTRALEELDPDTCEMIVVDILERALAVRKARLTAKHGSPPKKAKKSA